MPAGMATQSRGGEEDCHAAPDRPAAPDRTAGLVVTASPAGHPRQHPADFSYGWANLPHPRPAVPPTAAAGAAVGPGLPPATTPAPSAPPPFAAGCSAGSAGSRGGGGGGTPASPLVRPPLAYTMLGLRLGGAGILSRSPCRADCPGPTADLFKSEPFPANAGGGGGEGGGRGGGGGPLSTSTTTRERGATPRDGDSGGGGGGGGSTKPPAWDPPIGACCDTVGPCWPVPVPERLDYAAVFRLPLLGPWLQQWLLSFPADAEAVSIASIRAAVTEVAEVYRAPNGLPTRKPLDLTAMVPKLALNWLLLPVASINGITAGLVFTDSVEEDLDDMVIMPEPSGRFAYDEEVGEVFMTAWRPDNKLVVAWTQCVLSCERRREVLTYANPLPGQFPFHLKKRMSFYERRHCRLCGPDVWTVEDLSSLPPPCNGAPRRRFTSPLNFKGFGFPFFRGHFFGTVVLRTYDSASLIDGDATDGSGATPYADPPCTRREARPIVVRVRHGSVSLRRMMRLALTDTAQVLWSPDPMASRVFISCRGNQLAVQEAAERLSRVTVDWKKRRARAASRGKGADRSGHSPWSSGGAPLALPRPPPPPDDVRDAKTVDVSGGGGGVGRVPVGDAALAWQSLHAATLGVAATAGESGAGGGGGGVHADDTSFPFFPPSVGGDTPMACDHTSVIEAAEAAVRECATINLQRQAEVNGEPNGGGGGGVGDDGMTLDPLAAFSSPVGGGPVLPSTPFRTATPATATTAATSTATPEPDLLRMDQLLSRRSPRMRRGAWGVLPPEGVAPDAVNGGSGVATATVRDAGGHGGDADGGSGSSSYPSGGSAHTSAGPSNSGGDGSGGGASVGSGGASWSVAPPDALPSAASAPTIVPMATVSSTTVRPGPGTPSAAAAPAAAPIVTGTRRRRNADSADRDSVRYARQVRNRESAKRSNERRVRRVLAETAELAKLSKLLPLLVKRRAELEAEQADLRARLGMRPRVGVGQE